MKRSIKRKFLGITLIISLLSLTMVGCSGDSSSSGNKEVTFADAGWDSNKLHNNIAGIIAEELWDYSWSEVPGSTPVVYEGLIKGEIDINTEMWTDSLPSYKEDLEADKLKELSILFDDNSQGVYVPRYVIEGDEKRGIEASAPDLKRVEDLKKYPELFPDEENPDKARLYGSIPGWEVDKVLYNKFEYLKLDEEFNYFRPGSDSALATAITSAYEKGQPIATYYWEPTWLLGMYDMVLLEDEPYDEATYYEGKTAFPQITITVAASNDFADDKDNSELIKFLSNFKTSSEFTSEGLGYMQDTGADYKDTAKWILNEHPELLDEWLEADDAETMKIVLEN